MEPESPVIEGEQNSKDVKEEFSSGKKMCSKIIHYLCTHIQSEQNIGTLLMQ